jgi:hypothetical protein
MQSFLLKLHSLAVLDGGLPRNSPFVGFTIDSVLSHMSGETMDDRERLDRDRLLFLGTKE